MAATYDPNLSTPKDWVRFWTGDKVNLPAGAVLQDEEIDAILLAEGGSVYLAAYTVGVMIYSKQGGLIEKQVGDLRLRWSESAGNAYMEHLRALRERANTRQTEFRVV